VRRLLFGLLAPALVWGAGLQVSVPVPVHSLAHPIQAFHSVPAERRLMAVADAVLQNVNAVDYATTRRGAFPGTGGCELNPLLTKAVCQIDVPRFTGIKLAVGLFGVAQWLPVMAGWRGERYVRTVTVIDAALAVPLLLADVNNVIQLTK
jgi:hypothetical protein